MIETYFSPLIFWLCCSLPRALIYNPVNSVRSAARRLAKKPIALNIQPVPHSICLVRLSALGDVLMFVPLIRTLQRYLPEAKLTWVISPPAYDLVAGMDGVEFIVIKKPQSLGDYWRFKKIMQGRSFDVLLAAQACYRANFLYPLIHAQRKIGYDRLRAKDLHRLFVSESILPGCDHTLEGFLKFAQALGINKVDLRWDLPIDELDNQWVKDHLALSCITDRFSIDSKLPILLVNPAASKPERSWLVERYVAVIKEAQSRWGLNVILTGGPTNYDRELADQILKQVSCVDWVGKTKPKQLLALIKQSRLMICPDTGPSHMAAAMGTPVIALHAVTSSAVSGPYPYRHLAVDCYAEAVQHVLKKTEATNLWGTHAHGQQTMQLVGVDEVLKKMSDVLS